MKKLLYYQSTFYGDSMIRYLFNRFNKQIALLSIATVYLTASAAQSLDTLSYNAAAVLPTYIKNNVLYAVLSREGYGKDKGTYDSFGGSRDPHEHNPTITAARECAEEMISHRTMHLSANTLQNYINPKKPHTTQVLAHQSFKYVLYITRFDRYINQFFNNFYGSLQKTHSFKHKEKDRIATVAWHDLKAAIVSNKNNVCANVFDPHTNQQKQCSITLRPLLIRSLKPLCMNYTYQTGTNKKIRFYA